eukprot:TRINITY_DN24549_c0_g1_i1.p3 TRINITY_DN24549_c0_g1~~TRINITY_DN24549_c0_g1_i1.p3  ORF type:complete len:123 (+),score=3.47 TRINITY_DN24549_c0_g1_i1:240-608(+)
MHIQIQTPYGRQKTPPIKTHLNKSVVQAMLKEQIEAAFFLKKFQISVKKYYQNFWKQQQLKRNSTQITFNTLNSIFLYYQLQNSVKFKGIQSFEFKTCGRVQQTKVQTRYNYGKTSKLHPKK